jgi:hypothetical protein
MGMMADACNLSYSGGRRRKIEVRDPIWKTKLKAKRTGSMRLSGRVLA